MACSATVYTVRARRDLWPQRTLLVGRGALSRQWFLISPGWNYSYAPHVHLILFVRRGNLPSL